MAKSVSSNGIMIEDRADAGAMVTMRFTASQLHRMLGKDGLSRMDFSGEPEAVIAQVETLQALDKPISDTQQAADLLAGISKKGN